MRALLGVVMGENTKIEWCDHTWNPWIGCTQVGPPCFNCYAESMMDKRYGRVRWGAGEDRIRTAPENWKKPFKWDRDAAAAGRRATVFCLSLGDIWDNEVDPMWRRDAFQVMERTRNLIYLLLSKRIGNADDMCDPAKGNPLLPRNAALGSTFGDQEEYDRDRLKLKQAGRALGALFTFASIEPMLGPVILDDAAPDWIICGGETGRGARMMNPQWARDLRDASGRFGRAFFMKQMTNKAPIPDDLMVRQFPRVFHTNNVMEAK
jgi:protein gp37